MFTEKSPVWRITAERRTGRSLPLEDGEEVLKEASACVSTGLHPSWKLVKIFLTNRRLLFCQPASRILFQMPLERIARREIVERTFVLGRKTKQILIAVDSRAYYLAIKAPEQWHLEIGKAMDMCKLRPQRGKSQN